MEDSEERQIVGIVGYSIDYLSSRVPAGGTSQVKGAINCEVATHPVIKAVALNFHCEETYHEDATLDSGGTLYLSYGRGDYANVLDLLRNQSPVKAVFDGPANSRLTTA